MSFYGTFDDRNDARVSVKTWMTANLPEMYTYHNIRRLVAQTVKGDGDPVDTPADSWREGTYGAWIGILEFASEEIARLAERENNGTLHAALDSVRRAIPCLP